MEKGWRRWVEKLEGEEVRGEQAEMARRFFGERAAWNGWVGAVGRRRQGRWVEKRERGIVGGVLREWLRRTRRAKAEEVLVRDFRREVEARLVVSTVERWTAVIVERREREEEADGVYRLKLQAATFGRWANAVVKRGEDYNLADSFKDVKTEGESWFLFRGITLSSGG